MLWPFAAGRSIAYAYMVSAEVAPPRRVTSSNKNGGKSRSSQQRRGATAPPRPRGRSPPNSCPTIRRTSRWEVPNRNASVASSAARSKSKRRIEKLRGNANRNKEQRPLEQVEKSFWVTTREVATKTKKPRKRREVATKAATSKLAELVGGVNETMEEHLERHNGGDSKCPRCRFYMHGHSWIASYGSVEEPGCSRQRTIWVQERPARLGGMWGLGCFFCAANVLRIPRGNRGKRRLGTAWARHEVCPATLQAEHIKQHAQHYEAHKIAVWSHYHPDAPSRIVLQETYEDDRLLAGAVPQPEDWIWAWRAGRTPQSWKQAGRVSQTSNFVQQIRTRPVEGRATQQQVLIIRDEVRRMAKRELA